jgi:hypothetical protein
MEWDGKHVTGYRDKPLLMQNWRWGSVSRAAIAGTSRTIAVPGSASALRDTRGSYQPAASTFATASTLKQPQADRVRTVQAYSAAEASHRRL